MEPVAHAILLVKLARFRITAIPAPLPSLMILQLIPVLPLVLKEPTNPKVPASYATLHAQNAKDHLRFVLGVQIIAWISTLMEVVLLPYQQGLISLR